MKALQALIVSACALVGSAAWACSLCPQLDRLPLRQEAQLAKHVYFGTMSNPRLNAVNASGVANTMATDFTVDQVVKSDSQARKAQKQITIPRYIPADPKSPAKYLVFCDEQNGKLDPYRGTPVKSAALVEYLHSALSIESKDTAKVLALAGKYLDHADADVRDEAYFEFARASDADILAAAKKLDRIRIRKMLQSDTPPERLGLIAYLLGACGNAEDAKLLMERIREPGDRFRLAMGGLYAGLIMLEPEVGWNALLAKLADTKRPYPERNAALSALRFYHNANPTAYRERVCSGLKLLLPQSDIADLAIEDLRRWKIWDLTPEVLALFGQKSHDAPLMRHAIIRYALCCPLAEAKGFVVKARSTHDELVTDVEESLRYEQPPAPLPGKGD